MIHPISGIGRVVSISRCALVVGVCIADIRFDARAASNREWRELQQQSKVLLVDNITLMFCLLFNTNTYHLSTLNKFGSLSHC